MRHRVSLISVFKFVLLDGIQARRSEYERKPGSLCDGVVDSWKVACGL